MKPFFNFGNGGNDKTTLESRTYWNFVNWDTFWGTSVAKSTLPKDEKERQRIIEQFNRINDNYNKSKK